MSVSVVCMLGSCEGSAYASVVWPMAIQARDQQHDGAFLRRVTFLDACWDPDIQGDLRSVSGGRCGVRDDNFGHRFPPQRRTAQVDHLLLVEDLALEARAATVDGGKAADAQHAACSQVELDGLGFV